MKRVGLFILTNIMVIATISIITSVLGLRPYLNAYGMDYQQLFIFCLLWGSVGSFISLLMSKFMAKMAMGLQIVEHGDLVNKVHALARKAGIEKMPEVAIYHSPEINAFATGPSKNNSLVAVSTGLLEKMDDQGVEGVLGHEIAHIANGDMVTMALIQGIVNAFVMFASRAIAFAINNALRSNDRNGEGLGYFAQMMVIWVLDIVFSILARPVVAGFSRYREYRADAGGSYLAGKEKMISALEQLKGTIELVDNHNPELQAMKISGKSSIAELFSTHPTLDKRIAALRRS